MDGPTSLTRKKSLIIRIGDPLAVSCPRETLRLEFFGGRVVHLSQHEGKLVGDIIGSKIRGQSQNRDLLDDVPHFGGPLNIRLDHLLRAILLQIVDYDSTRGQERSYG